MEANETQPAGQSGHAPGDEPGLTRDVQGAHGANVKLPNDLSSPFPAGPVRPSDFLRPSSTRGAGRPVQHRDSSMPPAELPEQIAAKVSSPALLPCAPTCLALAVDMPLRRGRSIIRYMAVMLADWHCLC